MTGIAVVYHVFLLLEKRRSDSLPFCYISCHSFSFMWSALFIIYPRIVSFQWAQNVLCRSWSVLYDTACFRWRQAYAWKLLWIRANINKRCLWVLRCGGVSAVCLIYSSHTLQVIELWELHALNKFLPSKNCFSLIAVTSVYRCTSVFCGGPRMQHNSGETAVFN